MTDEENRRWMTDYRRKTAARELADIPLAVAMLRTLIGHGFTILAPKPGVADDELTTIEGLIQEIHDARVEKG